MLKRGLFWLIGLVLLGTSGQAWSKGKIVKMVIQGDHLPAPIEITDPVITDKFSIWNGPGTSTGGKHTQNMALDEQERRFIDWTKGIVSSRPAGLRRLEVAFYIQRGEQQVPYWFAYEIDTDTNRGYIFLPRWRNGGLIYHSIEGNWFQATKRWHRSIMPIIDRHSDRVAAPKSKTAFSCWVGTARLIDEHTIEIQLIDDAGEKLSRYRYSRDDSGYQQVARHIGSLEKNVETRVSCWPV